MPVLVAAARSGKIVPVLAVAVALLAAGLAGAQTKAPGQQPPTLVFVTQSDACDCVASLCVIGEQEVSHFLAANPWGFRRQTIDLKATPKAAKELGVLAVPVVFLLDGQGRRVARFDGFFAKQDFHDAWVGHLAGGTKR